MAQEWKVQEEFFPFACENCQKKFEDHEIRQSADTFGYVRLTNGEFTFVGLICPSCNQITLQKYRSSAVETDLNSFFYSSSTFVTFMTDGALKLDTDDCSDPFMVPKQYPPLKLVRNDCFERANDPKRCDLPEWFENRCSCEFSESDIRIIIDWENQHRKKLFPRLIGPTSIYHQTEYFLSYMKDAKSPSERFFKKAIGAEKLNELLMWIAQDHYLSGVVTTITEDEYKDLAIDYRMPQDYFENFVEACAEMLIEYMNKRDNFDFDQAWKMDFLDKYIKRIYCSKGYYKSDQYYQDKWVYEDLFEKVFKGPFRRIGDSQFSEIMSCQEVVKYLRVEPIKLIGYIANGELPAYYADHAYYDPRENSAQNAFIDPEKLLYLTSEVDELLRRHPLLDDSKQAAIKEREVYSENKQAIEYARIIFEESQWDNSINVAVQIGLDCSEKETVFSSDDLIKRVDEISAKVPISTINTIWEALPEEYRKGNDQIESIELEKRKSNEHLEKFRETLTDLQIRELSLKKKRNRKRMNSITATLLVTIDLHKEGQKKKRDELKNMFDKKVGGVTNDAANRIIKALPEKYRYQSGNPRENQDENGN